MTTYDEGSQGMTRLTRDYYETMEWLGMTGVTSDN